jgi:prepilin-type N-terminal cleavage/methylation domain-containing protein
MNSRFENRAFTLAELLVSIVVLTLLVLIVSSMVNSASTLTTMDNKRMDADSQARMALDRMAVDFAQMVKRPDVDYYLKNPATPQVGNDQIAFFSTVPGYYPPTGSQSAVSLVAYRVNSYAGSPAYNKMERMGKGLLLNGVVPPSSPSPTAVPMIFLPATIAGITAWSGAIQPSPDPNYSDPDYELVGPYVFRFEYSYLLKNGTPSTTPWDVGAGHTSPVGMQDVTAISVALAIVDPKSRTLLSDAQVATLAGRMNDYVTTMGPAGLPAQWQTALDATADMPRPAISGIRIYQRYFYLSPTL